MTEQATTLDLDEVSSMMLGMAFASKANEPALPHPDDASYAEMARRHDRWEQEHYAIALMLGIRLVNRLLGAP
jgi:hypothetical protein